MPFIQLFVNVKGLEF